MTQSQSTNSRRVIASAPDWHLSGVNVFTTRLFRELRARGWETSVVITNPVVAASELAPVPTDLEIVRLPATPNRAIRRRQEMLCGHLASRAPCVYMPNYDFDTAGVIPALPRDVSVAGVVHSDEDVYYDFVREFGAWMDAVVAVSSMIGTEIEARFPGLAGRITRIAYGVPVRAKAPEKAAVPPLRVLFAGRLSSGQKRIADLGDVIASLHERRVPVEFDIAGDGPDRADFERRAARSIEAGTTRMHGALEPEATSALFDRAHVLILTSAFEGLPVVMLEAMESGCVPVVTSIRSGVDELVEHGREGMLFPVGDVAAAVDALQRLSSGSPELAGLSAAARAKLANSEFTLSHAADCYEQLFNGILAARAAGEFAPKHGRAVIPRHHRLGPRIAARWARLTGANEQ